MGIKLISKVISLGYHHRPSTSSSLSSYCVFAILIFHISALCPPNVQYWDSERDTCVNCTKCNELVPNTYVIRPCEVHRDTICGPISNIIPGWSLISDNHDSKHQETTHHHNHRHHSGNLNENDSATSSTNDRHHHHRHHYHGQHHRRIQKKNYNRHAKNANTNDELMRVEGSGEIIWNIAKPFGNNSEFDPKTRRKQVNSVENVDNLDYVMNENNLVTNNLIHDSVGTNSDDRVVNERLVWSDNAGALSSNTDDMPFTNVETLVWDWQAIVLAMAVCACILFFLIAAAYSVHHARQWKRLKENFEADVEELSAKLNLMVASGDLSDTLEPNFNGPITDGNYHNNRCVYLEQLLVRKDTKSEIKRVGNVYIEEKNGASNTNGTETTDKITNG